MCGIAGMINYRNDPAKDILNMNRAMLHRGPDAGDYWLDPERASGFRTSTAFYRRPVCKWRTTHEICRWALCDCL